MDRNSIAVARKELEKSFDSTFIKVVITYLLLALFLLYFSPSFHQDSASVLLI